MIVGRSGSLFGGGNLAALAKPFHECETSGDWMP